MKFTLLPAAPLTGTLQSLSVQPESVLTPVSVLLASIRTTASNVRVHKHSIVFDMEQEAFDTLLRTLNGWTGQAVQKSSTVSAFEGSLAYHFGPKEE